MKQIFCILLSLSAVALYARVPDSLDGNRSKYATNYFEKENQYQMENFYDQVDVQQPKGRKTQYPYFVSGSAPRLFPTETFFGNLMWSEDDGISVPYCIPFAGEWGKPVSTYIYDEERFPVPEAIDMIWLSLAENEFYSIEEDLPKEEMELLLQKKDKRTGEPLYNYIIVGMAPYGRVAVWLHGDKRAKLIAWMEAEETEVDMEDFCPGTSLSRDEYVDRMLKSVDEAVANLETNGLPPRDLYDRYMQQFTYRYVVQFGHWDEEKNEWKDYEKEEASPELDYIEEALFDGTHDKLHDGGLFNYHEAGKPKKLALQFHLKKAEYSAFFWMDDLQIRTAFEDFYREHPGSGMDFVFRIDPEKDIYQIAFNGETAEAPCILNKETCQFIVFKDKTECCRSKNYNQPRGAWVW